VFSAPLCIKMYTSRSASLHLCMQVFLEDDKYEKMSMLSLITYTRMPTHYSTEICERLALLYAVFV